MAQKDIGPDPQNLRLEPLAQFDFETPSGMAGTRYWPKVGCDATGSNCEIGESGGPQEVCDKVHGCAPPVDTKFEASFDANGEDWVDISLVDGYTLPFRLEMKGGSCKAGFGHDKGILLLPSFTETDSGWDSFCDHDKGKPYFVNSKTGESLWDAPRIVDCSRLALDQCPVTEDMGAAGTGVDLGVRHPKFGKSTNSNSVGCYSPCSKMLFNQWGNRLATGRPASDPTVAPYCCPTPPESPEQCRAGPIDNTQFVRGVHRMCPGVYGYAYDDGMGLLKCTPDTVYTVTFYCPLHQTVPTPPPKQLLLDPCNASAPTGLPTQSPFYPTAPPRPWSTSMVPPVQQPAWAKALAPILNALGLSQSPGTGLVLLGLLVLGLAGGLYLFSQWQRRQVPLHGPFMPLRVDSPRTRHANWRP
eukprot:CAMPEP_0172821232 /NCGR_PEP_ID=MMETSP1075-20121228/15800_1 /TAXON_ID=2916 /ORGANISM="Ceratium fusus, Strain PA161109" /LENGTH=414 /DNA_ID=CAMNT_0013662029 /DNA_START=180 /DNA_END=1424 /DNA_ORIENTATION=-